MESKSCFKSKTMWANMLLVATGVCGYLAGNDVIVEYPHAVATFIVLQGILNIVLRIVTKAPVK